MKFRVFATTVASATITVEVDEEKIRAELVDESGGEEPTDELVAQELRLAAVEAAYDEGFPRICAQCAGWNRSYSLEIGDEWDVKSDGDDAPEPVVP